MNDKMNGGRLPSIADDPLSDAERMQAAAAQVSQQLAACKPIVKVAVTVMVQGLRVACPNIDVATLVHAIAEQTGESCAAGMEGDPIVLMQIRKGLQEAFGTGIRRVPMTSSVIMPKEAAKRS